MNNWEIFWSGAGAALLGAVVGPLVSAAVQSRWAHRDSLRAVLGEIRGNVAILRAHRLSTEHEQNLETIPIALSVSLEVYTAMCGSMSTWGGGTLHQVTIFYGWLRQLQQLVDAQGRAAVKLTGKSHRVADAHAPHSTALSLFLGACSKRDQAISLGEIAIGWIDDELARMAEFDPPRSFDYEEASK